MDKNLGIISDDENETGNGTSREETSLYLPVTWLRDIHGFIAEKKSLQCTEVWNLNWHEQIAWVFLF